MKKIPQPSDDREDDAPAERRDGPAAHPEGPAPEAGSTPARADEPSSTGEAPSPLAAVRDALRPTSSDAGGGAASEPDGVPEPQPEARPSPTSAAHGASGKRGPAARGKKKTARGPARRFARERALQALYQWDMAAAESSTVRREFIERQDMSRVDVDYFERLFRGISHDVEKVDASLADALDRPLGEVDPIERAVLRIAAFELAEVLETPARVVINEGVEITKRFGADNGHRYVNGVLDGLAATLRPLEMRRG